jgi:tRNA threonylcarbamoyl adenosine modification protein (Sua5/YciO/YrdC/YwlC family)
MSSILTYSHRNIDKIVNTITSGGTVVFPTETIYALACDATNAKAVERIYQIKNRKTQNPLSVMVSDFEEIKKYVHVDHMVEKMITRFSPGPITYVLELKELHGLSKFLVKNNAVGFRIPDHKVALDILYKCGCPLVATSVNISGEDSAKSIECISDDIKHKIDLIIDYGDSGKGVCSTVVKISNGSVEILRDGEIEMKEILKVISK